LSADGGFSSSWLWWAEFQQLFVGFVWFKVTVSEIGSGHEIDLILMKQLLHLLQSFYQSCQKFSTISQ